VRGSGASARLISSLALLLVAWLCACGHRESRGSSGPEGSAAANGSGEVCDNDVDDDGDGEPDCSDPDCLASASEPARPTAFADSVSWLYSAAGGDGCAPLQEGVSPGALSSGLVSVVRGRVSDEKGAPLGGAEVRVVGKPELGRTHSRGDGLFDIAVNGGGKVTIEIGGAAFLPVHRRTGVPVHDFAWVEPTVLKARSPVVSDIDLTGGGAQLLRAEASEDDSGRRQPAVLFPAGTHAMIEAEDGSQVPLDSGSVRVTEFTVGARGPEAMPADLPASSGYTYALELSVDEAESRGARGLN
jgi:hypothetical protein